MPDASIYWQPEGVGLAKEIDLAECLSAVHLARVTSGSSSQSLHNSYRTNQYGFYDTVRVVLERFDTTNTAYKLMALETHLRAGLSIGVTADNTKTIAGFIRTGAPLSVGDKTLRTTGDVFDYTGASSLSASDVLVIESPSPNGWSEHLTIESTSGKNIVVTTAAVFNHDTGIVMYRHRQFWPVLRLDMDVHSETPIITSVEGRERLWTLDMTLRVDFGAAQLLYAEDGRSIGTLLLSGRSIDQTSPMEQRIGTAKNGWAGAGEWGG